MTILAAPAPSMSAPEKAMTDRALIVLAYSGAVPVTDLSARGAAVIAATFGELGPVEVLEAENQDAITTALAASVSTGATLAVSQSGFGLALPAALVDPASLQQLARAIIGASAVASLSRLVDVAGWRDGFQADHSATAIAARAWWSQHLHGQLHWPFVPAPPTSDAGLANENRAVPVAIAASLSAMARARGWHPSTPWLGAWWLLLRVIADKPLTLWTELDGRGFAQLQDCLGKLAQHAPLSVPLEPGENFTSRLEALNRALLAGTERQDYAPTGGDRQITFVWHVPLLEQCRGEAWEERLLVVPPHDDDLGLRVSASLNQTVLHLHGFGRFIAKDDLSLLSDMLVAVLDAVATDPDRDWQALLPGTTERRELRQSAPRTIINDIARWARDCPDDFAVLDAFDSITYQQLWDRAGLVAVRLRALGAGPGRPVGLMGDRTVATAVAILGTWRAGAAYLPLDPSHPEQRLRGLLARAKAVAIVADLPSGTRAAALDLPTLLVTEDEDDDPCDLPEPQPAWAAYCIATSGSTGEPKLVQVEHRNLAAYCDGLIAALALEERHRFAMVTGWATDLGLTMFVAALTTGGALHLVPAGNLLQAAALGGFVQAHDIEILKITPGHLKALLAQPGGATVLPTRLIMLGGEAIPWGVIETIARHAPQLAVWNHYGPTETTIGAITGSIELAERGVFETPPLGQPFANLAVTVRDDLGGETGTWLPGQIFIAGDTVASGYCGAPAATASVFSPAEGGACAYATGDRGRRLRDGRIVYLGRRDFQVKIAGYRVDPGEVETALRSLPGVASAVVVARTNDSGETRLVAYAVPEPGAAFDPSGWRKALARILPPAALPTGFVEVAAIPLRDNGKPAFELLPPERPITGSQSASGGNLGAIEQVQAIWSELLGIAEVEPTERFFDIGGHSLQMVAMQQLLTDRLGIELTLLELFSNPSVAGIAQLAAGRVGDDVAESAQGRARRQRAAMAELKRRREEVMNHDH